MALWVCLGCTTKYAVGLSRCPRCHGTDFEEEGAMPKITVAGGPSHVDAEPGQPGYVAPPEDPKPGKARAGTAAGKAKAAATGPQADDEGGERSSPGSSSATSQPKPEPTGGTNSPASPPPARTTESPSPKGQRGPGRAGSTGGSGRGTNRPGS